MSINHLKGFVGDFLKEIFEYHNEIKTFAMTVIGESPQGSSVNAKIMDFIDKIQTPHVDILIKNIYLKLYELRNNSRDASRRNYLHQKFFLLKDLVRTTLNLELTDNGKVQPIFPDDIQTTQRLYIETQLQNLGFISALSDLQQAFQIFFASGRGALDLLRSSFENIVKEIIHNLTSRTFSNFRTYLDQLRVNNILIHHPSNPHPDIEANISYNLYSLLSVYGSHGTHSDNDMYYILFIETIGWIYLILKRYEAVPP